MLEWHNHTEWIYICDRQSYRTYVWWFVIRREHGFAGISQLDSPSFITMKKWQKLMASYDPYWRIAYCNQYLWQNYGHPVHNPRLSSLCSKACHMTFYRSDFTILWCWLFLVGDFQVVVGIFRSDIEEVDGSECQQGAENQQCDGQTSHGACTWSQNINTLPLKFGY